LKTRFGITLKIIVDPSVIMPTRVDAGSSGLPPVLPKKSGNANGIMAMPSRNRTTPVTSFGNTILKYFVNRLSIISRKPEMMSIP
jgi:hypothetical protein